MSKPVKYSPDVRERSVPMVLEHQDTHGSPWAAIDPLAGAAGCACERSVMRWTRLAGDAGRATAT
ncbi:hypothetical protein [Xanthomonas theicola]|uniref:hypothetical protein n=1 Tax=Xanthomonas theicola TaxID=56464 RepID=UPI000FF8A526|nr:hypothetical protein [Xanthomonas theicola]QNH25923.1 hypothetical protein G4Q83_15780 [Xanthomonas theicola]